jgi:mannose-6-phosphate isomerase-like protein (cupin superfamily)
LPPERFARQESSVSKRAEGEKLRRIFATASVETIPYDLDGPVQTDISYAPLSYDCTTQYGSYLMRMRPGSATIAHVHDRREEFLVLEGEAIESDGTVLSAGDWIVYEPGSRHNTRTETGCVLLGLDWKPPARE